MSSLNKVTLIGNLGRDPEIRSMQNGSRVCNLSLATSDRWKDKNTGDRHEKTEWHRIVIFAEHLVKLAEQYMRKGSKIYIEGSIETRKWQDQSGQDKYSTEVVLRPYKGEIVLLGETGGGNTGRSGGSYGQHPAQGQQGRQPGTPVGGDIGDDEIPF